MRRFLLPLIALALAGGALFGVQPQPARSPSDPAPAQRPAHRSDGFGFGHLLGGSAARDDVPQALPAKKFLLGRATPKRQYDYGHFHVVVGSDGTARCFPRFGKHLNTGKRTTPLPASVDWSKGADNVVTQMYLNDQYGDCVIASRYHAYGFWTAAETGTGVVGTDAEVYASYQAACGRGDNGCDMSAVNQYQQTTGFKVAGVIHKIDGAVTVDNTNQDVVKAALAVFESLNVGMNLPRGWYQSANGSDWGPVSGADAEVVGGHEVQAFGYDAQGVWSATWSGKRRILWPAFLATTGPNDSGYGIDELYTSLAPDWYSKGNVAPSGIDAVTLKADLTLVANGTIPPLPGPVPNPPSPPNPPTPVTPPTPAGTATLTVTGALAPGTYQVVPSGSVTISPDMTLRELMQLLENSRRTPSVIKP